MPDNRRRAWLWIVAVLVMVPVLYVLSLGPVCWMIEMGQIDHYDAISFYEPMFQCAPPDSRLARPIEKYACLWSGEGWKLMRVSYFVIDKMAMGIDCSDSTI